MLSREDLIYLGACFFLNRQVMSPADDTDMELAIEYSEKLFDKVFNDKRQEQMILE